MLDRSITQSYTVHRLVDTDSAPFVLDPTGDPFIHGLYVSRLPVLLLSDNSASRLAFPSKLLTCPKPHVVGSSSHETIALANHSREPARFNIILAAYCCTVVVVVLGRAVKIERIPCQKVRPVFTCRAAYCFLCEHSAMSTAIYDSYCTPTR